MFINNVTNTILESSPLIKLSNYLEKVYHDTTLYGDGTKNKPLRVVSNPFAFSGAGSPEGVVTAPIGSFYSRTNGGAGTSFYVKESGTGNTGWVAK